MHHVFRSFTVYLVIFFTCYINIYLAVPFNGVGVRLAKEKEFSFIVSIQTKIGIGPNSLRHMCNGALISKRHVITAEHCLSDIKYLRSYRILMGSSDLQACKKYLIKSWITYDQWAESKRYHIEFARNDIAVVTLSEKVNDAPVKPATISIKKNEHLFGLSFQTAGWSESHGGQVGRFMQVANLNILNARKCIEIFKRLTGLIPSIFTAYLCTRTEPSIILSCGDSGGPVFYKDYFNNYKIVGINSGLCAENMAPDPLNIHVSIEYYRNFINDVMVTDKHKKCWPFC
ncbi:hypothetical protein QAD02_004302 [Eretmocerus hayati]|uniref:Uncharacterized protein n=1 Tax=Eretmocerus hayati TaxID=131215 RepID=A0ACC2NPH9_9HYME|nr:hypothetical protein QAD02_004302 [Eretmocerus hayati]